MTQSPTTWTTAKLSEVATVVRGITFPASVKESSHTASNVCCLRTSNIQREVEWQDIYFVPKNYVKRDDQYVQRGDVLMSMANSYELVGKVAVAKEVPHATAFGAFLAAIRPTSAIDGQYLFHLLRTRKVQSELRQGSSQTTNIANISVATLGTIEVSIAPLPEQKRIADKLDNVLARVDTARARLERVPALLKRLRQSIIASAINGELTRGWREMNATNARQVSSDRAEKEIAGLWEVPPGWTWMRMEDVCEFITKGTTPSKEKMTSGMGDVPYIKVYNLCFDGTLDFSVDPTFVDSSTHLLALKRSIVVPGDVLMNIVGPPLGKVSIVPETFPEWNINQAIARFRPRSLLTSAFLANCLLSTSLLDHASRQAKATAGQFNLTLEICRNLPIPIPPFEEQLEINRKAMDLLAFVERVEARQMRAQTSIEQLTLSLLAKAFRGELVPQDPNDEPATELLERLAKQQSGEGKAAKGTSKRHPATSAFRH